MKQCILIVDNGDGQKRYAIRPVDPPPPVKRAVRLLEFGIAKRCEGCGEYPIGGACGCGDDDDD